MQGNSLLDESSRFNSESPQSIRLIQLGYLIQDQQTHPFSLTLQDLTTLYVLGPRAKDIYFNLLIQLCDDQHIPLLVMKGYPSEELEEQVCECLLWHLDLETDSITFNALDLGYGNHLPTQISILVSLFETFALLSPAARSLLHVIIWNAIVSTSSPTMQYLQDTLPLYQHHKTSYYEIRRLFDAIPHVLFKTHYDNVALSHLNRLPTIISGNDTPTNTFTQNLLLLKLLATEWENLPPLFLVNPPPLSSTLLQWLFVRYSTAKKPLVLFETQEKDSSYSLNRTTNFILSTGLNERHSSFHQQLTKTERNFLKLNGDRVAVRLRSEPAIRFIMIF
jgi:hypothetical protein